MKRIRQRIICLLAVLTLLLPQIGWAATVPKSEVVYGKMNRTGAVTEVFIVNGFESAQGKIVDTGTYSDVRNLTDMTPILLTGDRVEATPAEFPFFYQGQLRKPHMPWTIGLRWTLDGQTVETQDLVGKTGELGLSIDVRKNPDAHAVYAENYMLQIMVNLDGEKFTGIEAEGATIASQGNIKTVTFVLLPDKEETFSFTAQGKEIEIGRIQIAGLPFSMDFEMPDIAQYTSDLVKLEDAIAQLSGGVIALSQGIDRIAGGAGGLTDGAASLSGGARELADGMSALSGGIGSLQGGMKQYVDGLEAGLAKFPSFDDFDLGGWEDLLLNDEIFEKWKKWEEELEAALAGSGGLADGWEEAVQSAERLEQAIRLLAHGSDDKPGLLAASEQIRDTLYRLEDALANAGTHETSVDRGEEVWNSLNSAANGLSADMEGFAASLEGVLALARESDGSGAWDALQSARTTLTETANALVMPYANGVDLGLITPESNPEAAQLLAQMRAQAERLYGAAAEIDIAMTRLTSADHLRESLAGLIEKARERADSLRGSVGSPIETDFTVNAGDFSHLLPMVSALAERYNAFHEDLVAGLAGVDTEKMAELMEANREWMERVRAWMREMAFDPSVWKGVAKFSKGLRELFMQLKELAAMDPSGSLAQLLDGSKQLLQGQTAIAGAASRLAGGMNDYADGVSEYLRGIMAFRNGLMELASGGHALADGAGTLRAETTGMQDKMAKTMNEMMEKFLPQDFTPLSFAAEEEVEVDSVQFVWIAEPLEMDKPEPEPAEEPAPESFWDKLKNLFR